MRIGLIVEKKYRTKHDIKIQNKTVHKNTQKTLQYKTFKSVFMQIRIDARCGVGNNNKDS